MGRLLERTLLAALGLFAAMEVTAAQRVMAENWPHWRGPRLNGTSEESGIATKWSATQNVRWRLPLPGPAGATPVVWDDRIFLSAAVGDELVLICVSTDGRELWRRTVGPGNRNVRGDEGNSASPSPVTDGEHVWCVMGTGEFACYDFAGSEIWRFNLEERVGKLAIAFGMTSTPILDGDRLYMQLMFTGGAYVLAFDKATGETIWTHNRPSDARAECEHSYASPMLYRDGERSFLLSHGADYITAHRLSDGSEIWRCGGLNPPGDYNPTLRFVASPASVPGLIVVPSAKNGPVLGLPPDLEGDITGNAAAHTWIRENNTPDVPSPLIHGGLVYLCRENGGLICMDAQTGEEIYNERTHRQRHRASPLYADGKIYLTARDGRVTVVRAGRKFEILAENDLGEPITASPVVSSGVLYLRSFDALYAITDTSS